MYTYFFFECIKNEVGFVLKELRYNRVFVKPANKTQHLVLSEPDSYQFIINLVFVNCCTILVVCPISVPFLNYCRVVLRC